MSNVAQKIFEKNNISVDVKTGLSEEEIIKIIPEYDGMVVRSATKVTKKIIEAEKNLKVIGRAGAGVDNIDVPAAKENILFNNPKAILTPHIAASTTEASIVVAEMVANQISDFLLNGVKKNTV